MDDFFDFIDLPLLLEQKQALLRAMYTTNDEDKHLLDGILNLLDAIHDRMDPSSSIQPEEE